MRARGLLFLGLTIGMALAGLACSAHRGGPRPASWPPSVLSALAEAGDNRRHLEAVLQHYRERGDSLKLRAAEYLIGNMEDHEFTLFGLYDTSGVEVALDVLAYPDFDSLMVVVDGIEAERGELDYQRKERRRDVEVMRADFLIEHIDLAFTAWQRKPWARHLTFADFCAYVLPYRGSGEPLERWRGFFLDRYADLPARMEDPADPVEAARLINDDLRGWFRFDPRFYLHPTDQGLSDMLQTRLGRCEDMTNLTIFAMRANGLGVTSDYTPYWANAGNNHAWNAILDRSGEVVMFMGAEAQPGEYRLHNRVGKVYRKSFAQQPGNLVFQKAEWERVPRWLGGRSYVDVTADYTEVSDVTLQIPREVPDSTNFAYLCVFNDGFWRAIHWGRIADRAVTFGDMGCGVCYLPAFYVHEELRPAGPAFILEPGGSVVPLIPAVEAPISFSLYSTTRRQTAESTDGVREVFLEEDREYELFYWDDEWVSVGTQVAMGEPLRFHRIPSNGLYWLVAKDSRREERIFTAEEGRQVWW